MRCVNRLPRAEPTLLNFELPLPLVGAPVGSQVCTPVLGGISQDGSAKPAVGGTNPWATLSDEDKKKVGIGGAVYVCKGLARTPAAAPPATRSLLSALSCR